MLQIPLLRRLVGAHDSACRAGPADGLPGSFISMCMPANLRATPLLGADHRCPHTGEEDGGERGTEEEAAAGDS